MGFPGMIELPYLPNQYSGCHSNNDDYPTQVIHSWKRLLKAA